MTASPAAHEHVKPPQQARSRRTLERIVRAALTLLDEEGPDGLTVQAVVARAGSSVGSFYARFKGKEELLEYLEERVWDEARERWQEQLAERDWSSLSLEEVARGSARLLADAHRSRATFLKSLDRMGAGGGEGYASFRRFLLQALAELLLEQRARIRHHDPETAVRLALAALSGIMETGDAETGEPFAKDTAIREGSRLVLAYLMGEAGALRTPERAPASTEPEDPEDADSLDDSGRDREGDRDEAGADRGTGGDEAGADRGTGGDDRDEAPSDEGSDRGDATEEDEEDVDFFDVWG